jgi:hypothetical protein
MEPNYRFTILGDKKPLITNNMMFSKSPFCVSWSFGNGFEEEKYLKMAFWVTSYHLIVGS